MLGSTTAPGRPGARDDAPGHVAFRSKHSVGDPGVVFSRLNTQLMHTSVNASPEPSRVPAHDSGTVWLVPSRFVLEFDWRGLRSDEDRWSGSKVNRVIDEFLGQALPSVHFAHSDLT